jgi:dipeptidyl-peptidase-4
MVSKSALARAVVLFAAVVFPMDALAKKSPPSKPQDGVLRAISETNNFTLGRPSHVRVLGDGTAILFLRGGATNRSASLWELEVQSKKERLLLSAEQLLGGAKETLSVEEKAARERKRISTSGFTSFDLSGDGQKIILQLSGKIWVLERKSGRFGSLALPAGVIQDPKLSTAGDQIAFVRDGDLYVARIGAPSGAGSEIEVGAITALTTGATAEITHGLAEFAAQEEMHRHTGYWWAPDGLAIAYQRNDNRPLEKFTIADASRPELPANIFPYPRAGKNNTEVRLFVAAIDGKKSTEIVWDRSQYPYLARVLWQKNAPLSLLVQARDQRSELFLAADAATGKTEVLHEEKDSAWVNLPTTTPRWLPDGKSFFFGTERAGGWTLERHHLGATPAEKKVEVVLEPSSGYLQLIHVDVARDAIYFLGSPPPASSAVELHVFKGSLSRAKPPVQLSPAGGEHEAAFSADASVMVMTRVTRDSMPRTTIHLRPEGQVTLEGAQELPSRAMEPSSFKPNLELVPPEKAGGFNAMVLRPHAFDKTKKYPVILWVYGGPGYLMVHDAMTGYFVPQWFADHGFIVVGLDGRGTPRRGRDFERALRSSFGSVPLDDQVKGLTALGRTFPEMDLSRVGAYGWSFGGYMAALAVLRRPDVFKVAVAGAPVVDWKYYDTHYTERYLGLPDEDPQAYASSSLLTYADKLERPLLLVHGIADDNVYFAHTLQLADALFRAKRPYQLLPLVGLTHQVADPNVRESLYTRMVEFLGEALW